MAEWPEITYGLAKAGLVLVPINARVAANEAAYMLDDAERRAAIVHHGLVDDFGSVVERTRHGARDRRIRRRRRLRVGARRRPRRRPDARRPDARRPPLPAVHERHDRSPEGRDERAPQHDHPGLRHLPRHGVARGRRDAGDHALLHRRRDDPHDLVDVHGPDADHPPALRSGPRDPRHRAPPGDVHDVHPDDAAARPGPTGGGARITTRRACAGSATARRRRAPTWHGGPRSCSAASCSSVTA